MHGIPLVSKLDGFIEVLGSDSESTRRRCGLALLVFTLLSLAAQWLVHPVPLVATPHDVMGYMDAGYRVVSGQVPHNDFSTQFGPAFSYIYAIGVALFGPRISAVVFSNLMMMAIATLLAWLLSSRRWSPFLSLVFSATVMATTSGVVPLGWDAQGTDYAMSYNRHAFGILLCICMASFFPQKLHSSPAADRAEDVLLGALVAVLLLLKLNFFVIGVCAVVSSPFFVGFRARRFTWLLLGGVAPLFFFWLALGVKPAAFVNDMTYLYDVVRETRPSLLGPIGKMLAHLTVPLGSVLATLGTAGWLCLHAHGKITPSLVRSLVAALFLLAADLVLGVSNTQLWILVFPSFIALIALRELLMANNHRSGYLPVLILCIFSLSLLTIVRETSYIAQACARKLVTDPNDVEAQRIDSPFLENVYVPSGINGLSDYPLIVNDGLALLRRRVTPDTRLVTLNISDPFHFALGLKPTTGTQLYWWFKASYTNRYHLKPEQVLSNADMIIINKFWIKLTPDYVDYIKNKFMVIDEGHYWYLFKRKAP